MAVLNNSTNGSPLNNVAAFGAGLVGGMAETIIQELSVTTGFSITLANTIHFNVLRSPANLQLATGTITMPASPAVNQRVLIISIGGVAALTVLPNSGQSILNAPTSLRNGGSFEMLFSVGNVWIPYYGNTQTNVSINAGNPNGSIAGIQGDFVVDTSTPALWYCSTSGVAASAVWTNTVGASTSNAQIQVAAATTVNIVGTYNNGTGGIGATFTVTATGVQTFDGQTVVLATGAPGVGVYLFKNQTTPLQNGIYACTTAGAVGVQAVFTRATNFNTTALIQSNIQIYILAGTVNEQTTYFTTSSGTVVIGTTGIAFQRQVLLATTVTNTSLLLGPSSQGQANLSSVNGVLNAVPSFNGSTWVVSTTLPSGLTIPAPIFSTSLSETGFSVQTPVTGFSITLVATNHVTTLTPAGTLATGTITMPVVTATNNGLRMRVSTTQAVTLLTVNADAGHSILGAPTSLVLGQSFEMYYDNAITTWLPY
jgi:hypothetical protein